MASGLLSSSWQSENFYETTLSADCTDVDTDIFLTGVPTNSEGTLVIDPDSATSREIIYYSSKTGTKVVCPANGRGYDGSTASSHTSGTKVIMAPIADWFNSLKTLFTTTPQGWSDLADTPDTVTNNGNRSYDLVFNTNDLTDTVSQGMRLRLTRTVSAPTQCADLENGSSQHFVVTNATGLATGTTWTWKAKIKLESYTAGVIGAIDDGTNVMQMSLNSSGQLFILGGTFAANDTVNSYQSVPLGRWVDVTASITIGTPTGEIRFDDVVVPSVVTASAATTMTISGDEEIYIGRNSAGSYFDGKICQVALFNAVISDATLKTYSGQTMSGSETNCEGFWSLDGVLTDSSANANTLVAGGGAVATNVDSPFGNYLGGTLDYAIITKTAFSTNTTLTVQVPEGCAIPTSGGVSAVAYSTQAVPYGFPKDKGRWRLSSILRVNTSTTSNATYGSFSSGGYKLTVPIGAWEVGHSHGCINNATTTSGYFNISPTALTGLTFDTGADVSPLAIKVVSPTAAEYSISGRQSEQKTFSAEATYVMYTLGATTSPSIQGRQNLSEIFAEFNLF